MLIGRLSPIVTTLSLANVGLHQGRTGLLKLAADGTIKRNKTLTLDEQGDHDTQAHR